MICIDDSAVQGSSIELIHPFGKRVISHVIHDIDGTHSLIRNWHPVMSLSIYWAMTCGFPPDYDSDDHLRKLIGRVGKEPLPETDKICHENAGFSALTQLEYGVRRAMELGTVPARLLTLTDDDRRKNSEIIRRIQAGLERFPDIHESPAVTRFIEEHTPRLFQLYEKILNGACRDRNTADAWEHPEKWRVPGSLEFIKYLHELGCLNYFVTGAVVYEGGGMLEEVQAVGFEVGPGKMIEELHGSTWDRKMPKDEVMRDLYAKATIDPRHALVVGDGRTEIKAGVDMGSITISRLPKTERRLREIHTSLGVHLIVQDYTDPALHRLIYAGR
jgi:phosphoglycolate phosphatase-like HAD superfamily hydrolase